MRSTAVIPGSGSIRHPALWSLVFAFAMVYVIWGSTYLAIALAIKTIPPLMMAGVRFMLAGGMMYIWLRRRGAPAPTLVQWRSAFIVGGCLFLVANGMICIAEQTVPSGLTALLVATVPLWMTMLDWLVCRGPRPTIRTALGLGLGVAGIYVLVNPSSFIGRPIQIGGAAAIMVSCLSWAAGSLYSRRAPLPQSVFLATGMELFAGGALLAIASAFRGEWAGFDVRAVSFTSVAAMIYLMTLGSIVAFSAYIWLLNKVSPAAVSTYAFVNPAVAMLLGWMFAREPLTGRSLLAAGLIIAAVVMITLRRAAPAQQASNIHEAKPVVRAKRHVETEREPCEIT